MLMSKSLILTEIHNSGYTYRSLFINRFHEEYIKIEQVHSIIRGLVRDAAVWTGLRSRPGPDRTDRSQVGPVRLFSSAVWTGPN